MNNKLNHLAIIMDGNARWASQRSLDKSEGHKQGASASHKVIARSLESGIRYLTLYAFSSENWQRPKDEVSILMGLIEHYITNEIASLIENNIKLNIIGRIQKLSPTLQENIQHALSITANNTAMTLTVCISYGGRLELVDACQKIIDSGIKKIDENILKDHLYDPNMPDVDMLVRPSGVFRISNFLLWHSAYAELFFTNKFWPDFDECDIDHIIQEFSKRKRYFGGR